MNAASDKPRSTRSTPRSLTVAALLVMASASLAHAERRTTYYHTDALGSVVAASDQSGALLWRKQYAPFGEQLDSSSGAGAAERLAYTGKQHDNVLGLTYFGARHYDPHIGRFVSVDPAGFDPSNPASFNRYAYVNNNPYKYVDPDGEILNFAAKFVLDVGINIAFNYVTTGQLNVGGALKESALGILNPAKTLTKAAKLGRALAKGAKAAAPAKQAARAAGTSQRWKAGDDIYAPTKGGEPSWSTVRSRYWKNEAASGEAAEKWGAENVGRMKRGRAPQRYNADKGDTESMELSHEPLPMRDGGKDVVPRWPQDHAAVDPYRHPGY
jgi:RHS repeat-associated protein